MKQSTKLLFGIHMHQPIDNFEWVIEHGVEVCYGPFFEVMRNYPEFKFSLHCSGWLLEEIKKKHKSVYKNIKYLAKRGSIEFFSAGYYEPILSAIAKEDRVAQIALLNAFVKKNFGQTPKGLWLTERVWDASLIPDLKAAGIEYTLMDDYHFQCAGFETSPLDGYYMSEESGEEMGLFPISKKLRYATPFLSVASAIKAVKSFNREKDSAAIIFDDAEKFGMWPGTYEWVYEKEWLKEFVEGVLDDDAIKTLHFSDYYQNNTTRGIAYLPNVSYYEMGEWSLRADDALELAKLKSDVGEEYYEAKGVKFLKGGIWKNFFVKYEESNRIHKRTLELSKAQHEVNKKKFTQALYKAQANDALWHGVFGGLYLPNLRDNVYRYIIEAESIRYAQETLLVSDSNELDGHPKCKALTPNYIFRFDAKHGGQLVEFDSKESKFNWQNTLMRRMEAYHDELLNPKPKELHHEPTDGIDTIHHAALEVSDELKGAIIYDWHLKNSFIDHISNAEFNKDNFKYANFKEFGDFANQPFSLDLQEKSLTFSREGGIYLPQKQTTTLRKSFENFADGFAYNLSLSTEANGVFSYIMEHNFHFGDYEALTLNGEALKNEGSLYGTKTLEITDLLLNKKITLSSDTPFDLHYFALQTLSQSEDGFNLTTQGISFAMVYPFESSIHIAGSLEISDV